MPTGLLTNEEIVDAYSGNRTEFSALFLQSQAALDFNSRVRFEVVARANDDRTAYLAALSEARNLGFLEALLTTIVRAGLAKEAVDKNLLQRRLEETTEPQLKADLNAVLNPLRGFGHAEHARSGIARGMQLTSKILVDSNAAGTGLLIGPHLVLTAWHVVAPLFTESTPNNWVPKEGSAARLEVEFDDYLVLLGGDPLMEPKRHQRIPVPDDWCIGFGRCHPKEQDHQWPKNPCDLENFFDYVVLQLSEAPGNERGWLTWEECPLPEAPGRIWVFQHPEGLPLRYDVAEVWHYDSDLDPPDLERTPYNNPLVIPGLRFLHQTNTTGGSSGGPCFDDEFKLCGIHQGEFPVALTKKRKLNRGVPIYSIVRHYRETHPDDLPIPSPEQCRLWNLGDTKDYWPVIGCDAFQEEIWKVALGSEKSIIVLNGRPGSGKTFRVHLMDAMLPASAHLKIIIGAQNLVTDTPLVLADRISTLAGAASLLLMDREAAENTDIGWIQNNLVPALIDSLEGARNSRPVWIAITDLDIHPIGDNNSADVLYSLLAKAVDLPWLHIVLDGLREELPLQLRRATRTIKTVDLLRDDITQFARRFLADMKRPLLGIDLALEVHVRRQFEAYQRWLQDEPEKAVQNLAESLFELTNDFVEELSSLSRA